MKREQTLSSGMVINQDFADAIRPVFFQTEYEKFLYATDGGTLFLVRYQGRDYGMTCKHVFTGNGFDPNRLFVTQEKNAQKGSKPAPIKGIVYPSFLRDGAVGTDLPDLCVIEFADDIPDNFFSGAYVVDDRTIGTGQAGHALLVAGVLKEKTTIVHPDITPAYCQLEFQDAGNPTADPVLREGRAKFQNPEFASITGISGAPVFDLTSNILCGMVVRGGMIGPSCTIYYIDAYDILRFLDGVSKRAPSAYYTKSVPRPAP
jgi:hypothetical protein